MDGHVVAAPALRQAAEWGAALGDLKRVRDARGADSLAARGFRTAWARLAAGEDARTLALQATADSLAATLLGAIDAGVLAEAGVEDAAAILCRGFDEASLGVSPSLRQALRPQLGRPTAHGAVPGFAEALLRQPRAGATCAGKPRLILEPPENHGEHCFTVATLGVLLCPHFAADPDTVFCAGLAHHLHNAVLPDSGFAGEMLLGETLAPLMQRLFARALATLPAPVAATMRAALATIADAETPAGRAFHAADVLDRVLQMRQYERVAGFTMRQALEDLELVHAGPIREFHLHVLSGAGLW